MSFVWVLGVEKSVGYLPISHVSPWPLSQNDDISLGFIFEDQFYTMSQTMWGFSETSMQVEKNILLHHILVLVEGRRLCVQQIRVSAIRIPRLIFLKHYRSSLSEMLRGQRVLLSRSHAPCEFFQMFRRLVTVKLMQE